MSKNKPSQSISGSQIFGSQVQIGQAEGNLTQFQQDNQSAIHEDAVTTAKVIEILGEIREIVSEAELPQASKEDAIAYLSAAQKEVRQDKPDKELVAKNLKRMGDTLKTTSDTVDAGTNLWNSLQPMITALIGWFGAAKSLIGF